MGQFVEANEVTPIHPHAMIVKKEATEPISVPVTPLDTEMSKPSSGDASREDTKSANGEQPVGEQQGDDRRKKESRDLGASRRLRRRSTQAFPTQVKCEPPPKFPRRVGRPSRRDSQLAKL